MTEMHGDVGFREDLLPTLEVIGQGGDDAYERLRYACLTRGLREHVEREARLRSPRFPFALARWLEDGQPHERGTATAAFFRDLENRTEFWDVYHQDTGGRFSYGDLSAARARGPLLGATPCASAFAAWLASARSHGPLARARLDHLRMEPATRCAILSLDLLLCRAYSDQYGDLPRPVGAAVFLDAILRYALDVLPPDRARLHDLPAVDARRPGAERHRMRDESGWHFLAFILDSAPVVGGSEAHVPARRTWLAGLWAGAQAAREAREHRAARTPAALTSAPLTQLHERALARLRLPHATAADLADLWLAQGRPPVRGGPALELLVN